LIRVVATHFPRNVSSDTVALSDRGQPAYQNVLDIDPGDGVGSGERCSWRR